LQHNKIKKGTSLSTWAEEKKGKERKRKERKNLLLWKDEQEEIRHCGAAEATWWKSWDGMWQGVVEGLEKRKPCGA